MTKISSCFAVRGTSKQAEETTASVRTYLCQEFMGRWIYLFIFVFWHSFFLVSQSHLGETSTIKFAIFYQQDAA